MYSMSIFLHMVHRQTDLPIMWYAPSVVPAATPLPTCSSYWPHWSCVPLVTLRPRGPSGAARISTRTLAAKQHGHTSTYSHMPLPVHHAGSDRVSRSSAKSAACRGVLTFTIYGCWPCLATANSDHQRCSIPACGVQRLHHMCCKVALWQCLLLAASTSPPLLCGSPVAQLGQLALWDLDLQHKAQHTAVKRCIPYGLEAVQWLEGCALLLRPAGPTKHGSNTSQAARATPHTEREPQ